MKRTFVLWVLFLSTFSIYAFAGDSFQSWPPAHRPYNIQIDRTEPGTSVTGPQLWYLGQGNMVVQVNHIDYKSDAVATSRKLEWFRSIDGGITWKGLDKRPSDVGPIEGKRAVKLKDGTYLAAGSYGWENYPDTLENRARFKRYAIFDKSEANVEGVLSISYRAWMKRSRDGGKTWLTEEIKLPTFLPELCAYMSGILLRDGTYITAMFGQYKVHKKGMHTSSLSSLALLTRDGGNHWDIRTIGLARPNGELGFNETTITQAANGDIVAIMRTTDQKQLWAAISKDSGQTWSEPFDTGMRGSTPVVVTTKNGLLVNVYVRRSATAPAKLFPQTGVYACVSRDHGRTWDKAHQVAILDTGTEVVDGYPQAEALADGSVYTVYSFHGATATGGTRFHPLNPAFGTGKALSSDTPRETTTAPASSKSAEQTELEFQQERTRRMSNQNSGQR